MMLVFWRLISMLLVLWLLGYGIAAKAGGEGPLLHICTRGVQPHVLLAAQFSCLTAQTGS